MGKSLITRSEYKTYAGISSTNFDDIIDSLIPKVSELVKNYCRRTFVDYVDDSKVFTTNGGYGNKIYLDEYPIIQVVSVGYSVDYGQTYEDLIEYEDYVLNQEDGTLIALNGDFPEVVNGYLIEYNGGYETLPEDLKLAVLDLVTYYMRNDSSIHSPKAPGTNSVQIEYITTSNLPAHIKRILDLYKASWH